MIDVRLLTVILALALQGTTPQQDLDAARAQWKAANVRDYEFTLRESCFCPPADPERSVVRDGAATQGRTIEQVFDIVQQEIDSRPDQFSATYGEHGIPLHMSVDRIEMAVDDEYAFEVSDFQRYETPPPPPAPKPADPPADPPAARDMLADARAAWQVSGIRRHSMLVTRLCTGRRAYLRRDWTVPRLHAFIARTPSAQVRYGRHGIPRSIAAGGCRYAVTRFRRAR